MRISSPSYNDSDYDRIWDIKYIGPRVWVDYEIIVGYPLNVEAYKRRLKGEELNDPSVDLLFLFVGIMDDIIPMSVLASNISAPGMVRCIGGGVCVDDQNFSSISECGNHLLEHLEEVEAFGWPGKISISFAAAYKWVKRTIDRNPNAGKDRVSRALAAYSNIAACSGHSHGGNLMLFWAMMGLEALYCDGSEGLKKQIFDKAAVLFGPLIENKKEIREVYDFRSAFIHGAADIPYAFWNDSMHEDVREFDRQIHKAEAIAFILLIRSLQWLVKRNKDCLEFKYSVQSVDCRTVT